MKMQRLTPILAVLCSVFICAALTGNVSTPAYQLKFKVQGLKEKDTVILANYYGEKQYVRDTAYTNSKGEFTFDGKEKLQGGIYIVVLPNKQYFEIIVQEQTFYMETNLKDLTANMQVKNSIENKAFYEYLRFIVAQATKGEEIKKKLEKTKNEDSTRMLREQGMGIEKTVSEYRKKFIETNPTLLTSKIFKAMTDPEIPSTIPSDSAYARYRYFKDHYWDNIDLNDDRLLRTPIFHSKLEKYIKQFTLQTPDSINKEADRIIGKIKDRKSELFKYCIWYITNQYETSQIMGMDAVFVHMAEKYYLTGQAYWINEETENKIRDRYNTLRYLLLKSFAPPLAMQDTTGKTRSFTSIKANYTILYFWDPNCGHCQKETPKLKTIYDEHKSRLGFEVYAINTQTDLNAWKNFIKSNNLNWINVYDPQHATSFHKIYDIYSTPTMYILDDQKRIIAKRLGVEQVVEFLENDIKIKEAQSAKK